jgi:hypothetical protein
MADVVMEIAQGFADVLCPNCESTERNTITLNFNVTQNRLEIVKRCVCMDVTQSDTIYVETSHVATVLQ